MSSKIKYFKIIRKLYRGSVTSICYYKVVGSRELLRVDLTNNKLSSLKTIHPSITSDIVKCNKEEFMNAVETVLINLEL